MPHSVFISYRRDGGEGFAQMFHDRLRQKGFRVFYDIEALGVGEFDRKILREIERADVFLLILSKNALDRCANEGDWVRREIAHAMSLGKPIIPLFFRDFTFPSKLPAELSRLPYYNGVDIRDMNYLDAKLRQLCDMIREAVKPPKKERKKTKPTVSTLPGKPQEVQYLSGQKPVPKPTRRKKEPLFFLKPAGYIIGRILKFWLQSGLLAVALLVLSFFVPFPRPLLIFSMIFTLIALVCYFLDTFDLEMPEITLPLAVIGTVVLISIAAWQLFYVHGISDMVIRKGELRRYYANEERVEVPDGVISIGDSAFPGLRNQRSNLVECVILPDSVRYILDDAFRGCASLTEVYLGEMLVSIGYGAFANCPSLRTIYYNGTAEDWAKVTKSESTGGLFGGTDWDYGSDNYEIVFLK